MTLASTPFDGRYWIVERHPRHPFVYRARHVGGTDAAVAVLDGRAKFLTRDKAAATRVADLMTKGIYQTVTATSVVVD